MKTNGSARAAAMGLTLAVAMMGWCGGFIETALPSRIGGFAVQARTGTTAETLPGGAAVVCRNLGTYGWPGLAFVPKDGGAWDLSGDGVVQVTVSNMSAKTEAICATVVGEGMTLDVTPAASVLARPGMTRVINVQLAAAPWVTDRPVEQVGMRGKVGCVKDVLDFHRVKRIDVYQVTQGALRKSAFAVLDIRTRFTARKPKVIPADSFYPFVDEYGQFRHDEWPGKIHSDEELRRSRLAEEAWLAKNAAGPATDRDRFGGWSAGPQLRATGFFRTEKIGGKWWLVDPDGRLFFSLGVTCVYADNSSPVSGREKYFAWIPPPNTAGMWSDNGTLMFNVIERNMMRKYGNDWKANFADTVHRRFRAWGLNTIANWSHQYVWELDRTPYAATIHPSSTTRYGKKGGVPDPFSPQFERDLRERAKKLAEKVGNDPWCIGVFVDNELGWDRVPEPGKVAEKYFATVARIMHEELPNHLYLGARFAEGGADEWRAASRHCDVVSFNFYERHPVKDLPEGSVDKPIIVGEFHFGALDRGRLNSACTPTFDQAERARCFSDYVNACLDRPRFVGCHWFQYQDQALAGRGGDGENYQIGFTSVCDVPYAELVEACRETSKAMYTRRAAVKVPVTLEKGREWENHTLLHEGKEPPCSAFASFPTVEEARAIRPERCSRRVRLDSETAWRFRYAERPEDRPVGFQDPAYDVSGWDVVKVPCSWQAIGINRAGCRYGTPYYIADGWPFVGPRKFCAPGWPRVRGLPKPAGYTTKDDENPVGSYRRDFDIPADWAGDEVFLEFGAVDSFFYLWVNGKRVGFSKSNRDPARFNVTPFVKTGRNTVALEVYAFSDGSYLEDQDMYHLSGIARSVWLFHTPRTHLRDVRFTTAPVRKGDYGGEWKVSLETDVVGGKAEVRAHVFDEKGAKVPHKGLVFASPKLWSAEEPNLYTLVLELVRDGKTLEAVGFQLGFREVEIREAAEQRDRTFLLNGQPIKMRGANRHESSPTYGHYTPDELIELDVKQLKRANCNHVRNSHYPQPDYFYYLCNKYGIYVMDEANNESHGFGYGKESISHEPSWRAAHVDRAMNMVERNKCHPCIVIWSLGNEAGPGENFRACVAAIKARDLSRPVQYERNNWLTDMGSLQYPSVDWLWRCARGEKGLHHEPSDRPLRYPFHLNEYAHNMGNAMGNLKDYQDAIESTTRICGAAIWDWVDQGLWKRTAEGKRILAYGGDWGEKPNTGAFMMNGCVLADRALEPGYWEIKHVFQPIVATKGADGKSIEVQNRHYFRDLSAYECVVTHFVDGVERGRWVRSLALAPRGKAVLPIENGPVGSYRLAFRQKATEGFWPAGWVIAEDQIDFTAPKVDAAPEKGNLVFGFDPKTGELASLKAGANGAELLKSPLTLDLYRAPSQNEPDRKKAWNAAGAAHPVKRLVSFAERKEGGARLVESAVDYALSGSVYRVATTWRIKDGAARVKVRITASGKPFEPAHLGLRTTFAFDHARVDWLGCGPWENYADRKSGAFLGNWSLDSREFFVPYDTPQDCGNREGTYRVTLAAAQGAVVFETRRGPFAFEVNPYAPETLAAFAHPPELPKSDSTFFGLWARSRGIGNNSCGPLPLPRDIIAGGEGAELEFVIRSPEPKPIETWRMAEWTFESARDDAQGGGDAVPFEAAFTHAATGKTLVRPGFWDGGRVFRVRFAPTAPGRWRFRTRCPGDAGLDAKEGAFEVVPYAGTQAIYRHGFLRAERGRKFLTYADGTPFFYLGDTHWGMYREEIDAPGPHAGQTGTFSHFAYIVRRRAEQGFTVYQSEPIDARFNVRDGKVDASDIPGFRQADRYYRTIADAGLVHANAEFFFASEMTPALAKDEAALERLCRYWNARFGAFPVLWTLAQEIDNDFYADRKQAHNFYSVTNNPWVKVAAFMHRHDAYAHPLSGHQENVGHTRVGNSVFADETVARRTGHAWWAAQWSPALRSVMDWKIPREYFRSDRPAVNYEGRYCYLWTKDFGARAQGWMAFLNGFCGYGYGTIDQWLYLSTYDTKRDSHDGVEKITIADKAVPWSTSLEFPSANQMGILRGFFERLPWWELRPDLGEGRFFTPAPGGMASVAAKGDALYVLYFSGANTVTGTVRGARPNGRYAGEWFNPRTGARTPAAALPCADAAGVLPLPPKPDSADWTLTVSLAR